MNMYKEVGDGTPFKYEHCWEIMRKNPKWCSSQLTKIGNSKKAKTVDDNLVDTAPPLSTPTTPRFSSSHENDHIDVDGAAIENSNVDDGVVPPLGRKGSKEKKKRMNEQRAVADVLSSFQCTLEKQYTFNQQNLELRQQMLKKDLEFKEKAQQLKEEAQRRKQKAEKRKEQERILNIDLNSLQPTLRNAYEKMQAQIVKEWEKEGLFGDVSRNDDVEM